MNLGVWPMAALGFAFLYVMTGAGSNADWGPSYSPSTWTNNPSIPVKGGGGK